MQGDRLGLIAGGGAVPGNVADAAIEAGMDVHILAFEGVTEADLLARLPHTFIRFDKVGRTVDALKKNGCTAVCMVGKVARPDFAKLRPDFAGISLLPKVVKAAAKGDDALLQVLVGFFEKKGFRVLGAHEIAGDVLAESGPFGKHQPTPADQSDIDKAVHVVNAIGGLDIGQGAVVRDGLVLAVEAAEGTDRMLARCTDMDGNGGVLVKLTKPGQDHRVDLPTIGTATVEGAALAGLSGIAVEAGAAMIIDRAATVRIADEKGLFITGIVRQQAD
jgi:DUF1009 family protein